MHPNWKSLSTVDIRYKTFVREGTFDPGECNKNNAYTKLSAVPTISGDEAKEVYEEIIQSVSDRHSGTSSTKLSHNSTCNLKQNTTKSTLGLFKTSDDWINAVMRACENNCVTDLGKLLVANSNLNFTDKYGWTMLMTAACAGSKEVVQYLLEKGADVNITDRKGYSCVKLAKLKRNQEMVELFKSVEFHTDSCDKCNDSDTVTFYCDTCKKQFSDISKIKHETSILHLFNLKPRVLGTIYGIPECNKGFQILLKTGWNKEQGLGPEGVGSKYPIKTVLKRDRKGLGASKEMARVTHFDPLSYQSVRTERRRLGKKQIERKRLRDRHKEKLFRREFY